jgi:hypothetical protein
LPFRRYTGFLSLFCMFGNRFAANSSQFPAHPDQCTVPGQAFKETLLLDLLPKIIITKIKQCAML